MVKIESDKKSYCMITLIGKVEEQNIFMVSKFACGGAAGRDRGSSEIRTLP